MIKRKVISLTLHSFCFLRSSVGGLVLQRHQQPLRRFSVQTVGFYQRRFLHDKLHNTRKQSTYGEADLIKGKRPDDDRGRTFYETFLQRSIRINFRNDKADRSSWTMPIALITTIFCSYFHWKKCKFVRMAHSAQSITNIALISCGSFNPPTVMHLRMFDLAKDYLQRNTDYRVISGILSPVHQGYGKKELVPAEHRVAMLKLATRDSLWLHVDDWESTQPRYCPTVAVLRHTREICGKRVMLLCGADLFRSFIIPKVWKPEDVEEILRDFGVVVITRLGTDLDEVISQSEVLSRYKENIMIITEPIPNEVSSTKIRQALKQGQPVRYLVPDATLEYIYERGLYGSSQHAR